ncbi:MAG: Gfo/Idh/MocA family oxidoreductase, partial [Actinomycetota bacterium]|nr:Gfo/Idh/MocA family oxidoreductase [Actinomycetota bacterium]
MSDPVKVAVAGGGYGSKVALPVYSELEEFQPVAVWSRRPERARELAEQAGLELGTSDLEELLRFPGLEAVHVATPVVTHPEFARAVAERGLHLLCEKPLADNLAAARGIAETARRAGVVAAVNYGRRFEEGRRRLLERGREVLGRPRLASVSLVFADHADPDSR